MRTAKLTLIVLILVAVFMIPVAFSSATPAQARGSLKLQWTTGYGFCGALGPTPVNYGEAFSYNSPDDFTWQVSIESNTYGISGSASGSLSAGSASIYSFVIPLSAPAVVNPPWTVQAVLEGYVGGELKTTALADFVCNAGGTYGQIAVSFSAVGPGCDVLINIPETAVGGTFVTDAPIFWAPGQQTEWVIPAGNSARVIGMDATGQYYQIIWVCDFVWVQAATLGPNYDAVWNGAPLPTGVIK